MTYSFTEKKRIRKNCAKKARTLSMPNLLAMQLTSYQDFLQLNIAQPLNIGLQKAFNDTFPIKSNSGHIRLDFLEYKIQNPVFDSIECISRGVSYAGKIYAKVRLTLFDKENDNKTLLYSTEELVYMGEIPFMTANASFVINGNERVIVSQLHRSPGVYFEHDYGKNHVGKKLLYSSRIIPYRGSWLDLEFDAKDIVYFRIDKRRKMPITLLLKAMSFTRDQILNAFYDVDSYIITAEGKIYKILIPTRMIGEITKLDIIDLHGNVVVAKDKKITNKHIRDIQSANIQRIEVLAEELEGSILAHTVYTDNHDILAISNTILTVKLIEQFIEQGVSAFNVLYVNDLEHGAYIADTLALEESSRECATSKTEAIHQIYKMLRPGEPYSEEIAYTVFARTFFHADSFDLSEVGRSKFNFRTYLHELDTKSPTWLKNMFATADLPAETDVTLNAYDVLLTIAILVELRNGRGHIDDIDHLGNRRIRSVGELVDNQIRIGLTRIEKAVKEKISQSLEERELVPNKLFSAKPINTSLRDFFATSPLSQFMDQTNPLSELTHKRRISALGPGGLTRNHSGFEVRDVHVTHYGRLCPVETPEGANIGLIASLAGYAQTNKYGFLETPYFKVTDGYVTKDVEYLSAINEESVIIAHSNAHLTDDGRLIDELVQARQHGETVMVQQDSINYIDVSANQVVSIAASLIPFLEHDDANRALMGSNMQRQGVPCLKAEKPLVGTGIERAVAIDSGTVVVARRGGQVSYVDATKIIIKVADTLHKSELGLDIYDLIKYLKSNQNTCINQKPIVRAGDIVAAGDVIADGSATDLGELSVGQNVLVAFMPWNGYNFEDSILISERLVASDKYTSIHIEEISVVARETKQGNEEITADIPNLSQTQLARLDCNGMIHIGAEVKTGDVLVGKVTPQGEIQLTPEEKLLRAIFGEKASDVKDTSLRVPVGMSGTVINIQRFNRDGHSKDAYSLALIEAELQELRSDIDMQIAELTTDTLTRVHGLINDYINSSDPSIPINTHIAALLEIDSLAKMVAIDIKNEYLQYAIKQLHDALESKLTTLEHRYKIQQDKLYTGVELINGVITMVKVFIAVKRRLQPGDKMAGRHGNKGVVSKILPVEDMPYTKDGQSIDIVLNPLGVPSRMNIGQILEVHLGFAAKGLGDMIAKLLAEFSTTKNILPLRELLHQIYNSSGQKEDFSAFSDEEILILASNLSDGVPMATPIFDGIKELDIKKMLKLANLPESGQVTLYDGRTGLAFDRPVTIGYMYMLRLHHLVDEKIHARSTGPYSLVTQQPLGGKSQFGGQRFGEMEVWALEAYGAAYTLQEMLTVKSDDVDGRTEMYENLLDGNHCITAQVPEAFRVLTKEIMALGLNMELE